MRGEHPEASETAASLLFRGHVPAAKRFVYILKSHGVPARYYKVFEGYDVVTFSAQTSPECSPLSCNALASGVEANTRCLLQSFEQARALLENGTFNNSEPGPYRVFAVYSVAWSGTV